MNTETPQETAPVERVTVIKESSGGNGGMVLAIVALVLVALGGFYLLSTGGTADPADASIAAAADKVGAAADQVGDAASEAASKIE